MTKLFWAIPICLVLSCYSDPGEEGVVSHEGDVPDVERLVERIGLLWDATERRDWRAWYDLTGQGKSGMVTFEEFKKEFERQAGDKPGRTTWSIVGITEDELDSDEGVPGTTAKARVPMDVTIAKPGEEARPVEDLTDYWYYIDGDWYWGWRGFPSD